MPAVYVRTAPGPLVPSVLTADPAADIVAAGDLPCDTSSSCCWLLVLRRPLRSQRRPCRHNRLPVRSPKYSELDFWLGEWDARGANAPADRPPNSSVITKVHGGCVILETWRSPNYSGQSFNIYDRTRGQWHQTWVDSGGGLQEFWGGLKDGNMVYEGNGTAGERADSRRTDADDVLQPCARQSAPARRALIGWRKDVEGTGTDFAYTRKALSATASPQ